jgi:hypothetical protein
MAYYQIRRDKSVDLEVGTSPLDGYYAIGIAHSYGDLRNKTIVSRKEEDKAAFTVASEFGTEATYCNIDMPTYQKVKCGVVNMTGQTTVRIQFDTESSNKKSKQHFLRLIIIPFKNPVFSEPDCPRPNAAAAKCWEVIAIAVPHHLKEGQDYDMVDEIFEGRRTVPLQVMAELRDSKKLKKLKRPSGDLQPLDEELNDLWQTLPPEKKRLVLDIMNSL